MQTEILDTMETHGVKAVQLSLMNDVELRQFMALHQVKCHDCKLRRDASGADFHDREISKAVEIVLSRRNAGIIAKWRLDS